MKRGRPMLPDDVAKLIAVSFRCSPDEFLRYQAAKELIGVATLSTWIRDELTCAAVRVLVRGAAMSDDELEAKVREMVALDDVAFVSMLVYRPLAASWIAQREALRRVEELHEQIGEDRRARNGELVERRRCKHCGASPSCQTVRALKGEPT